MTRPTVQMLVLQRMTRPLMLRKSRDGVIGPKTGQQKGRPGTSQIRRSANARRRSGKRRGRSQNAPRGMRTRMAKRIRLKVGRVKKRNPGKL